MLALTQSTTFLIGPIAKLLGLIMEGICSLFVYVSTDIEDTEVF